MAASTVVTPLQTEPSTSDFDKLDSILCECTRQLTVRQSPASYRTPDSSVCLDGHRGEHFAQCNPKHRDCLFRHYFQYLSKQCCSLDRPTMLTTVALPFVSSILGQHCTNYNDDPCREVSLSVDTSSRQHLVSSWFLSSMSSSKKQLKFTDSDCCIEDKKTTTSFQQILTKMSASRFSVNQNLHCFYKTKLLDYSVTLQLSSVRIFIVFLAVLLCQSLFITRCNAQTSPYAFHRYPRIIEESSVRNPKLNRSLTLMDVNQMGRRQPPYNHLQFCGDPPLVSHAQSNLKRNQKHFVFKLGQEASYMCDQGYINVGGTTITRCIIENSQTFEPTSASHVFFPSSVHSDPLPQVSLLGSGRSKNSKRLMSDLDEEPDVNANGHRSVLFPNFSDKRKMSRKTDDDLIGTMYESNIDGRSSDLENDSIDYLEKKKQNLDKSVTSYYDLNNQAARWWPPVTLNCQLVNCTDPGHINHAKRRDPQSGIFSFNSNVFYECEEGYETIGIPILTCRANGSWNRSPPTCRLKQCPPLAQLNDGRILYSDADRRTDSRAEYYCNPGYRLNAHSTTRHCRQDDQWSPLEPLLIVSSNSTNSTLNNPYRCIPVECPVPIRPHSGLRILPINRKQRTSKYVPGDVIIYSCSVNKIKASAKCRPDGEWSRGAPHCPSVSPISPRCPPLTTFSHGSIKIEQNRASFACLEGYQLEGASIITCNPNGVWNLPVPRCVVSVISPTIPPYNSPPNTNNFTINSASKNEQILDQQEQKTSKTLTVLLTIIAVVIGLILAAGTALFCRWRQQQYQRKRWQQYFGHYHHRQSKTNIVLSSTYHGNNGTATAMSSALPTSANGSSTAATKHLLQRQRPNSNSSSLPLENYLQSSFSSSDDNCPDIKSFNTGTISSEQAQTISTYADDTCPEDEDEEDEYDIYMNASILANLTIPNAAHPKAPARRQHNSLPLLDTNPTLLLTTTNDLNPAKRTLSSGQQKQQHIYSNCPNSSIPLKPITTKTSQIDPLKENQLINGVPVTDL